MRATLIDGAKATRLAEYNGTGKRVVERTNSNRFVMSGEGWSTTGD